MTHITRAMQKASAKYNQCPYKLLTAKLSSPSFVIPPVVLPPTTSTATTSNSISPLNKSKTQFQSKLSQQSLAQRYEEEIAPPSKMKEYVDIASKCKVALLAEAKELQQQYQEDIKAVQDIEHVVESVANMLTEFTSIVNSQSSLVDLMQESSQSTTESVQASTQQLKLTIERTKSNSWNMVFLSIFLGCILLFLDYVTP